MFSVGRVCLGVFLLIFQIYLDLIFDQTYHFVDNFIAWYLEVFRSGIIAFDKSGDCFGEEWLFSTSILYEVKEKYFIEVRVQLIFVIKVDIIVKLGEL